MSVLVTLGYEGRTVDEVVDVLRAARVAVLVDVRLTPQSRKPGLSKRRLAERLEAVGLRYRHLPDLGNPKSNRDAFHANDPAAIETFRNRLLAPAGAAAIDELTALTEEGTVALLCLEREPDRCHRRLVADRLVELRPGLAVRHV